MKSAIHTKQRRANFNDFLQIYSRSYLLMKAKFADIPKDCFLADQLTYKKPKISREIGNKFYSSL